jgi:hypothetical protein
MFGRGVAGVEAFHRPHASVRRVLQPPRLRVPGGRFRAQEGRRRQEAQDVRAVLRLQTAIEA